MSDVLLIAILVLLVPVVGLLAIVLKRSSPVALTQLSTRFDSFDALQERTARSMREETAEGREEFAKASREQRQDLAVAFKAFGDSIGQRMSDTSATQNARFDALSHDFAASARSNTEQFERLRSESSSAARQLREEVVATLNTLSESLTRMVGELVTTQRSQFDGFQTQIDSFASNTAARLDNVRTESAALARQMREEITATLIGLSDATTKAIRESTLAQGLEEERLRGEFAAFTRTTAEHLDTGRGEAQVSARHLREEVVATLKSVSDTMANTMTEVARAQQTDLESIRADSSASAKQLREELIGALQGFTGSATQTVGQLAQAQRAQLETMAAAISRLTDATEGKLEAVRMTVSERLQAMQVDNAKQIEVMRQTVDEKLQGTLEKRLGESFRLVSDRLELVHKGLGEMQSLATGVGDLKKVLTNVKTRGTWGEVQLGALLEQVLHPDQFSANVATKGGGERVEFAIKLPGQGAENDQVVWLPIDAKFPIEDYQRLVDAQDNGDAETMEIAGKNLEARVKACAWDICEKYLNPPTTTDFAILFLPIEGLFAEVIRRTGLLEFVQRECRVVIAGPTTLWSVLNSLQLGFRTLAIQKRSSDVWNLLAAVKTEWAKYGEVLDGVQKRLHQATETIDKVRVRSRAVGRKLKDVQELAAGDAESLLSLRESRDADAGLAAETT